MAFKKALLNTSRSRELGMSASWRGTVRDSTRMQHARTSHRTVVIHSLQGFVWSGECVCASERAVRAFASRVRVGLLRVDLAGAGIHSPIRVVHATDMTRHDRTSECGL